MNGVLKSREETRMGPEDRSSSSRRRCREVSTLQITEVTTKETLTRSGEPTESGLPVPTTSTLGQAIVGQRPLRGIGENV